MVRVFPNTTNWYQNASFLIPLVGTAAVGILGAVRHSGDLLGFAAFLAVVTLLMVPVVLAGWRQTPTAIVVTRNRLISLHEGRVLRSLNWADVHEISRRETQGNVRWAIEAADGVTMYLDGEIQDLDRLMNLASQLAQVEDGAR